MAFSWTKPPTCNDGDKRTSKCFAAGQLPSQPDLPYQSSPESTKSAGTAALWAPRWILPPLSAAPWGLIHHKELISLLFLKPVNQPHNHFLKTRRGLNEDDRKRAGGWMDAVCGYEGKPWNEVGAERDSQRTQSLRPLSPPCWESNQTGFSFLCPFSMEQNWWGGQATSLVPWVSICAPIPSLHPLPLPGHPCTVSGKCTGSGYGTQFTFWPIFNLFKDLVQISLLLSGLFA